VSYFDDHEDRIIYGPKHKRFWDSPLPIKDIKPKELMQIRITFIVSDETTMPAKGKGQPYSQLEVTYKDDKGQTKSKKIMSFANPAVFATLKNANKGDVFDVEMVKNGDYWNWTSIAAVDGSVASAPAANTGFQKAAAPSAAGRSNFETPEERALRQRLIVRQSSLTTAVAILKTEGEQVDKEDVFELAEELHDWVYRKPDLFTEVENDIPF
jgi:hypothetical protein